MMVHAAAWLLGGNFRLLLFPTFLALLYNICSCGRTHRWWTDYYYVRDVPSSNNRTQLAESTQPLSYNDFGVHASNRQPVM